MTENKKPYHHGNLHQSLIAQATVLIAEVGVEQLSMRSLAQAAGVSRTAAYHHFTDKNALLCAIAEQGFDHWHEIFSTLMNLSPEPLDDWLSRFISAYIDFAVDNREEYDLMFGRPIWKTGEPSESLKAKSADCFHRYVDFIARWQSAGMISQNMEAIRLAQVSWSTLHGISRLLNDGVYLNRASVDAMSGTVEKMLIKMLELE